MFVPLAWPFIPVRGHGLEDPRLFLRNSGVLKQAAKQGQESGAAWLFSVCIKLAHCGQAIFEKKI